MVRYPEPDDLRRAQAGDPDAFARIYRRFAAPLHQFIARQFLGTATDAEEDAAELCQDTFTKAWLSLTTPGTKAHADPDLNLQSWLYRIATNVCRDLQRHRKLVALQSWDCYRDTHPDPPADDDPERDALRAEDAVEAAALLAQLHPRWRDVLALRDGLALSYPEIAARLGLSRATVKARIFRARARLRAVYAAGAAAHGRVPQLPALVAWPVGITRAPLENRGGVRYRATYTVAGRTNALGTFASPSEAVACLRAWEARQRARLREVA